MTIQAALAEAMARLRTAGIDGAERDVRLLMAVATGIDRGRLTLHLRDELTDAAKASFLTMVRARETRTPVSHILKRREFFGRSFIVSADVLDPRPETELLVSAALNQPFQTVLDLGTGSGAIVLTLLAERPAATGTGTDLSDTALAVAAQNARVVGVDERLHLHRSDWLETVVGRFDLIVSNPPYIAADEMPGLSPEVRDHEPRMALTDGADGLTAYRCIAAGAPAHLAPGGWLMVEIGPTQGPAVSALFRQAGLHAVAIRQDFDGRDRVVLAQSPRKTPG